MFGERLFLLLLFFFVLCPNRARVRCVCVCVCCCIVCIVRTQTYVMLCLSYLTRILSRSLYPPASMPFTLCISSVALHASIEVNSSRLCEDETATTTTKNQTTKRKQSKPSCVDKSVRFESHSSFSVFHAVAAAYMHAHRHRAVRRVRRRTQMRVHCGRVHVLVCYA